MRSSGKRPSLVILSSDDEGRDRKKIVDVAPTDSEEVSDRESDSTQEVARSVECSDTDSASEWLRTCSTPEERMKLVMKEARVKTTIADRLSRSTKAKPIDSKLRMRSSKESTVKLSGTISRTTSDEDMIYRKSSYHPSEHDDANDHEKGLVKIKSPADRRTNAKPIDSKLRKRSSKKSTKVGGNISSTSSYEEIDRKLDCHANENRRDVKNGADEHSALSTERNVRRRKMGNWQCHDLRPNVEGDEFTPSEGVLRYNRKEMVIHGAGSTSANQETRRPGIDRREKFGRPAERTSSTTGDFDPASDFLAINEALKDSLHAWVDKANEIDFFTTWFSRKKTFSKNGLSITLSDEEIQRRNNFKAGLSATIELGQFDPADIMSRPRCQNDDVMKSLMEHRSSLHYIVNAIHTKKTKSLAAAKGDAELAIKHIIKSVQKAADAIPVQGRQVDHLGFQ